MIFKLNVPAHRNRESGCHFLEISTAITRNKSTHNAYSNANGEAAIPSLLHPLAAIIAGRGG